MPTGQGKSNTVWIVLGIAGGLTLLCCTGAGVGTYFGARHVAENPEEFQASLRGVVADLAGKSDVEARRICTEYLTEDRLDETWERTSTAFRGITDRDGLTDLHAEIEHVMGDLISLEIRNYNVRTQLGSGKFHDLIYDGSFVNGEATVKITLREKNAEYLLESLRVESPLFSQDDDAALRESIRKLEEANQPQPEDEARENDTDTSEDQSEER